MAELEDVTLDGKPLHSLRVADLKAALEQRGLPKSGQKNALIKRLKGALMLENLQKTSSPHIGLQPNSQIGVEMSQNSFIKQYLAKQQELLRQRLEREAREAAEADTDSPAGPEEEDHTGANDGTSYLQDKHHLMPSHPQAEMGRGDHGGGMSEEQGLPGPRGLDLGPGASDGPPGRIWRPSFFSSHEESATPSPPRAVASLSVRVVGQPDRQGLPINIPRPQEREGTAPVEPGTAHSVLQLSQSAKAAGRAQEESEDDDDDDGDSDEDDEWGPSSHGRKSGHILPMQHQPVPAAAPARERSRRKLQPPQHIPPQPAVHQPAVQLRQPTPPPSPPPELSFPLPDTPKQSPPDLEAGGAAAAAAVGGGDDAERPAETSSPPSLQRQDSSSSSRSSSPDPPGPRRPGPLSLLARKMESEGAFAVERSGEPEEQRASGAKGGSAMGGAGQGVLMFSAGMKTQPGPVQQPAMFGPRVFVSSTQEPSSTGGVAAAVKKLEPEKGGTSQPHQAQENEGTEKRREKREKEWEPENMLLWRGGREVTSPPTPVMSGKGESILGQNPTPFHLTSTTTSPPAVTKRPRMFSEVPPPSSLLCPPKSEQRSDSLLQLPVRAGVLVSGPQEAEAEVPTVAASETPKPAREDKGNKVQADPEKRALPQAAKGAEEAQKPLSLLPPSPPPEDLAKAKEQARTREKERERRSSPSSGSSSSDSDSESSSSSGSSPAHSKSLPASKKKGEEEKRRKVDGKGEERGQPSRDVKQAALPESAGSAAMEMEERPESECALTHPAPQGAPDITDSPPNESSTPKAFAARKISLTTSKTEGPSSEVESGGGANRKRRWGSSTAVTAKKPSISITTESLKSLIPDIKSMPPLDAVVELHPEEGHLSGDEDSAEPEEPELEQGLKIRRTVTQVVPADGQENGQKEQEGEEGEVEEQRDEEKDEAHPKERRSDPSEDAMETQSSSRNADAKKVTPSDTLVRRSISQQKSGVSVTVDDPVRTGKPISPPRNKVSNIIHICNLVRPFTLGQLKELLNRTGTLVEEGFWIDKIKSHCYVTYSNVEEAEATRAALHGVKWPSSNPKVLSVEFCQQEELDFHKGLLTGERAEEPREQRASGPPARPGALPPLMPDPRERGTGAVGGTGGVHDQWAEREREMARRERTRSEREWDRDKVRDLDRDGTSRRSRSRERRRRERGKSKERKTERKDKPTEEPPAKLLDDLFRKTKAAPCIYWLPLTEEQVVQRNLQRAERMKERERKRKELQEEEDKKREEERKERAKGREKEGGNAGPGGAGAVKTTEGERDRERDRERDKERERERDRVREREGDKRRDGYRGRGGDPKAAGGRRRSRSRSNPPRDRRR